MLKIKKKLPNIFKRYFLFDMPIFSSSFLWASEQVDGISVLLLHLTVQIDKWETIN